MFALRLAVPLAAALSVLGPTASPANELVSVGVEGTRFRVAMADGRLRYSDALVGAVLTIGIDGRAVRVRIDWVQRDTLGTARSIWLHSFSVQGSDGHWHNPCAADADGRHLGFPLAGRAEAGGILRRAEADRFELVCTAGAQAKCARFGYRPWANGPDGKPLLVAYNACVRLLRGDYGGRDEPMTNNGMLVDIYDPQDIQKTDGDPTLTFEAGWDADGAVCVHHPRVRENVTLEQLEARYPRLRGRTGAICTEEFARSHGALIFNRSRQGVD